jgi:nitroreductase
LAGLDTLETIARRRSIRAYKPGRIPDEDVRQILEAARLAPSAANRQPVHFVLVRDPDRKRRLGEACAAQHWIADADFVVACVGLPSQSQKWYQVDCAIAMQQLVLSAAALGYGTCWVGAFSEASVKQVLGIPDDARVVAVTPLGIPGEQPEARGRKSSREVFSSERFGSPLPSELDA